MTTTRPSTPGRPPVYQYDRYADGSVYEMIVGRDTTSTIRTLRNTLRTAAERRGFYLQTQVLDDKTMRFRFLEQSPEDLASVPGNRVKKGMVSR